MQLHQETRP